MLERGFAGKVRHERIYAVSRKYVRLEMSLPSSWYLPEPHRSGRCITVYQTSCPKNFAEPPKSLRAAFV
jgi:hypothetical protein